MNTSKKRSVNHRIKQAHSGAFKLIFVDVDITGRHVMTSIGFDMGCETERLPGKLLRFCKV